MFFLECWPSQVNKRNPFNSDSADLFLICWSLICWRQQHFCQALDQTGLSPYLSPNYRVSSSRSVSLDKIWKYGMLLLCRGFAKWILIAGSLPMRDFCEVGGSFCEESIAENQLHIPSNNNRLLQMALLDLVWKWGGLDLKRRLRCWRETKVCSCLS